MLSKRFLTGGLLITMSGALCALSIEGRLPGKRFKEDNPPLYGAKMSFVSRAGAQVLLYADSVGEQVLIKDYLQTVCKRFKIKPKTLIRQGLVEGSDRWLRYSYSHEKQGGGFLYVTRKSRFIVYLMIFNLQLSAISQDLPDLEKYVANMVIGDGSIEPQ